ncbi:MAG TPA: GDP-mannose 4,6-dehydratase [Candidatus Saccharimonadales bacterium]|nr:GDP-mannose 4,6-dehydratase [Candidatus Saccharimonadales bacterium]
MPRTRILVTGGAGFIGSHLVEALLSRGDEVWALDDLSTGRRSNLASFESNPRFHFIEDTVTDPAVVGPLVERVEQVFHLAAAVGVKYVVERPLQSLLTNIRGAEVVLAAAARSRARVILFSSSEVYGKGNGTPLRESDDQVLGPTSVSRWSYATGKAVDEFLAFSYWHEQHLPVVIVRCFNTCGPRQRGDYGMVIPRFVEAALRGEPITVYGDGQQTRCFSYVGDVVRGVLLLAGADTANGEVFNIGTDEEISIHALAARIRDLTRSSSPIVSIPYEEVYGRSFEDMMRRVPDLTKIRSYVGFTPAVALDQLLRLTIEHVSAQVGIPLQK